MANYSKRILITRPKVQAEQLADKLKTRGWEPVIFPTIEIADPPDIELLKTILADLSKVNIIVFISPNAVAKTAPWIKQIPQSIELVVIGEGTAKTIKLQGWKTPHLPPSHQFNSEETLKLPVLQSVQNKTVLICRGVGGNELLGDVLRQRGATVIDAIAYERRCPTVIDIPSLTDIDWVICTSGESLRNLIKLFGRQHWPQLFQLQLITSSRHLQDMARDLGFVKPAILANNATDEAILAVLNAF